MAINKRDQRALLLTGLVIAGLTLFLVYEKRQDVKAELETETQRLSRLALGPSVDPRETQILLTKVPVYADPQPIDVQRIVFERQLSRQLNAAGLGLTSPLKWTGQGRGLTGSGYKVLRLQGKAKGKFEKMMQFLADLPENPQLLSIEMFHFSCEDNDRSKVQVTLECSTLAE